MTIEKPNGIFEAMFFPKIKYYCYICSVKEIGDADVSYLYFDMPASGCRDSWPGRWESKRDYRP